MTVPHENVRAELERVLASDDFANAERLRRLLRFLVERVLDGREHEIKEFVVGTEVFDRGPDYDPRIDSIVRVEMRRLRGKLDEHYAMRTDDAGPIVIRLRKGSYVPLFVPRADAGRVAPEADAVDVPEPVNPVAAVAEPVEEHVTPEAPARGRRLLLTAAALFLALVTSAGAAHLWRSPAGPPPSRVAVLPFAAADSSAELDGLAAALTNDVTSAMVRVGAFEVVPRRSAAMFTAEPRVTAQVTAALHTDWLVEAMLHPYGTGVRAEVRLVDAVRDRKVWVEDFIGAPTDLPALATRIAARMGERIADSR